MKVVLLQDVKNVGQPGDVKEVSAGYAKNYLIPSGLAALALPGTIAQADQLRKASAARRAKTDSELSGLAAKMNGTTVEIVVKAGAEGGRIYGSVTTENISDALKKAGFEVDKKRIALEKSINELGTFPVTVKLSGAVSTSITVVVKGE
ncbi:MAG: 50S ribosomal protein L9 [Dehalococcoidia bacterium]|nr:50S ribosomal protein L9 [Dehalococcoidia bacterium]